MYFWIKSRLSFPNQRNLMLSLNFNTSSLDFFCVLPQWMIASSNNLLPPVCCLQFFNRQWSPFEAPSFKLLGQPTIGNGNCSLNVSVTLALQLVATKVRLFKLPFPLALQLILSTGNLHLDVYGSAHNRNTSVNNTITLKLQLVVRNENNHLNSFFLLDSQLIIRKEKLIHHTSFCWLFSSLQARPTVLKRPVSVISVIGCRHWIWSTRDINDFVKRAFRK